ncbi:hypothetical protein CLPUN_16180 [Clostridium puniceum]|uniref:Uncharacterized protein n=1 Tax=Clostridium puniceum TaxID=29367 RepID=A0A1S8TPH4_9CLOT|nr:hypothetical protein [Clostridium puniceum]OOM79668.1 hypothetical protein CLPUN_16180 [Clostridium puniceum]
MRIEFEKIDVNISHKEILKSVNLVAEHNKITGIIGLNDNANQH